MGNDYIYTSEGKIKSEELAELILQGKNIKILDVENVNYKFYKDNENKYDFAQVTINEQNYLIFFHNDEIIGINEFDEDLISRDITEINNEKLTYDAINAALLCANGFNIISYYEYYGHEEATIMIGFEYNNEKYITNINASPSGDEISTEQGENIYYELFPDELSEKLNKNIDIFKVFMKEAKTFIESLEKENNIPIQEEI